MSQPRRYRLLCPIARALDRLGDRWTLLILRDLHAGPARFSDLETGLTGIASNLLTTRLRQLQADGLVRRREAEYGVSLYQLTEMGEGTADLLYELAAFGSQFPPDDDVRQPGNLRVVALTLKVACRRVVDPQTCLTAELVIDGERFELVARDGDVEIQYRAATDPDVIMETSYQPMVAVMDGVMSAEEFAKDHVCASAADPGKLEELMALLVRAVTAE
jgi:DNA-binding HxlR family transcriptional regulator